MVGYSGGTVMGDDDDVGQEMILGTIVVLWWATMIGDNDMG